MFKFLIGVLLISNLWGFDNIYSLINNKKNIKIKDCITVYEKRKMFNYKKIKECTLQSNEAFIFLGIILKNDKLTPASFNSITSGDAEQFRMNNSSYGFMAIRNKDKIIMQCISGTGRDMIFFSKINKDISSFLKKKQKFTKNSINYVITLPFEKKNKYQFCIAYNNSKEPKKLQLISYAKEFSATFWKNIISSLTKNNSFIMNSLSIGGALLNGDSIEEFAHSYFIGKNINEIKNYLYKNLDICKKGVEKFACDVSVDIYSDIFLNMYNYNK